MQKQSRRKVNSKNVQTKKLDPKTRRRNRYILFTILGLITAILLSKCTDNQDESQKLQSTANDSNSTFIKESTQKADVKLESSKLTIEKEPQKQNENINLKDAKLFINDKKIAIGKLLESYRKKPSISRALAIADFYYSSKKYEEAIGWAVLANKIDIDKKRPWIIYIKSKIAQKDYKKAVKAIKAYLQIHNSNQMQKLLEVLETKIKGAK